MHLSIDLSKHLDLYLDIHLAPHLSIYLSVCLHIYQAIGTIYLLVFFFKAHANTQILPSPLRLAGCNI